MHSSMPHIRRPIQKTIAANLWPSPALFPVLLFLALLPALNNAVFAAGIPVSEPVLQAHLIAAEDTTENTVTFVAEAAQDLLLPVEPILQYPELPNGCEATSLAIALNYLGYPVDKTDLAASYIHTEGLFYVDGTAYGPDPATSYVGSPFDDSGYYVLAPALADVTNRYLAEQGSGLSAIDISGEGETELLTQLDAGNPVIVWATMDFGPAQTTPNGWVLTTTGEYYAPYSNLHCMVLAGYDEESFFPVQPVV